MVYSEKKYIVIQKNNLNDFGKFIFLADLFDT